ncbi:MarR family winged helix-turn-helix transcriptional regulator [Actinomadura sp. NEAU-AAG7]|uniref:MarR family winged helix-turn-helix transcriptional regulator n=1 Tax=Actinomadura sp. NEAU-AAG7 TaxID=2839640 RepID=UPI001BE3EC06|nr:MarR family winged helix-turn-helix transcriptional regulator [Actinomadura sp. NEAU-AAG7]MBT2213963.1 MarR family winged helix-turn-helix transcriptional regulator [Actinomadura sp. NEAU-AAG7]
MRDDVSPSASPDAPGDEVDAIAREWRRSGISEPLIAMLEVGKRAQRIGALVQQALRDGLAEYGLTYAEFEVLTVLHRAGPPHRLRPSDLTGPALLTSGGTSNVLQRLQKAGHVEREADTADARSRFVRLTEDGLRVTERGMEMSARVHEEIMAGLPPETVRAAADALRDVHAVIGRRRFR